MKTNKEWSDVGIPDPPHIPEEDRIEACGKTLARLRKNGALPKILHQQKEDRAAQAVTLARYLRLVETAGTWSAEVAYLGDNCGWHLTTDLIALFFTTCKNHAIQERFLEHLAKSAGRQNKPSVIRRRKYLERREEILNGLRRSGCKERFKDRLPVLLPY